MKALHGHGSLGGPVLYSLFVGSALFLGASAVLADEPAAPVPATPAAATVTIAPAAKAAPAAPAAPGPAMTAPAVSSAAAPALVPVLPPARPLAPPAFQMDVRANPDSVVRPYRYPALRIAGIVVTGVGIAGMLTGGAFLASGAMKESHGPCDNCGMLDGIVGFVSLVGGAGVATIGAPLWIVGSVLKKEPAPEPTVITLLPQAVSVGPGSATLRWEF